MPSLLLDTIIVNGVTGAVSWFGGGASYAPGNYQIVYVRGAFMYSQTNGSNWTQNTRPAMGGNLSGTDGMFIVGDAGPQPSGSPQAGIAPGSGEFTSQAATEAANAGASVTYTHAGGRLGLFFLDESYADNAHGSPDPTFSLYSIPPLFLAIAVDYSSLPRGNLTYSWNPPTGPLPDSYNLYEGSASGAETLLINVAGTITNYQHSGVIPGYYYAYVKAVSGGIESAASNEVWCYVVTPYGIPQGATKAIGVFTPGKPFNARSGAATWDIEFEGGIIADSDNPQGWNCRLALGQLVVSVPEAAEINLLTQPYRVRYDDGT